MNYFKEKIKKYRKDNNLTQEDLAKQLNVSRQAVSKWETGSSYPNIELLNDIAVLLNVSLDVLISKEEITNETIKIVNTKKNNKLYFLILTVALIITFTVALISITISLNHNKSYYIINFDTNGGTYIDPIKIKAGSEIILSDIPTKDYCEFLGWDKEIPDYMPKYNFTLTAKWQNIKEDFIFSTNTIYKYIGNKLDVRIPRWYTIDGIKYEILNIAQNSFSKTKVNNVIISDGVLIIDDYAFYGADNLIEVKIPESINYIGKYAFANCKKLKNIILPKQINVIYENTFENCESLINVNLGMINEIKDFAFNNCFSLTNINFNNSLFFIGKYAFNKCYNLNDIFIPKSVLKIGENAFGCFNDKYKIYCEVESKLLGWEDSWKENYIIFNYGGGEK